jgi:RNA recognition motif. (a.k.a. RRM, RBD, or RNP domain)
MHSPSPGARRSTTNSLAIRLISRTSRVAQLESSSAEVKKPEHFRPKRDSVSPPREFPPCSPLACASTRELRPLDCHFRNPRDRTADRFCLFPYPLRVIEVTKLYVGNLPFTATEDAVRTLFATHGSVDKVSLINDRDTGRPRGFAFVEMSNADASRAMQALNGTEFEGRALKVSEAQDRARSGGPSRGPRRY